MAARKLMESKTDGSQVEYTGKSSSAGAGDVGEVPVLDASGKLDNTFMPVGLGADSVTAATGETLAAGDYVYFNGSGAVMKADASNPAKAAQGYVLTGFTHPTTATVYFDDSNTAKTGLTAGAVYYLSGSTPGAVTTTAPTTSGYIAQEVGFASSATNLRTAIKKPVTRA